MGASFWLYLTRYASDPSVALAELQSRVFKRREYEQSGIAEAITEHVLAEQTDAEISRLTRLSAMANKLQKHLKDVNAGIKSPSDRFDAHVPEPNAADVQRFRAYQRRALRLPARSKTPKYKSIAELRQAMGDNGTHSVLDVEGISLDPKPYMATPMSDELMEKLFGTLRPSEAQIEQARETIVLEVRPGVAWYTAVWRKGRRAKYCFVGCTGD